MAFYHGKVGRLFVDQFELSNYFSEYTAAAKAGIAETTVFGRGAKTFIGGLLEGQLTAKGFFDDTVSGPDQELAKDLGFSTNTVVTFIPSGVSIIGTRAITSEAAETDYTITAPVNNVVGINASFQSDSGLKSGVILRDPATLISTIATIDGVGVNDRNLASLATTTNGLVATAHILTLTGTGTPTVSVKIQHSDDNATYADLVTLTIPAGISSGSVTGIYGTVPMNTVINRFIRARVVTTGTTISSTVLVAAARM